ncbi:MAG TPA: RpiB/LacA/LacB family sugar-phosphate isomerase [Anaerolineaceae bacterium]|nr:RpiB/LacA/LacB family sugar-phosphate isomerase [Anaerolineaceae bacterium]
MRVAVGCDHGGFLLKFTVIDAIIASGHEVIDYGTDNGDVSVDFPDFVYRVGDAIQRNVADRGIIICGSGVGASVAANKMKGIIAGLCHDHYSAHQGVEHDHMNVLCLGAKVIGSAVATELTIAFLGAEEDLDERFVRRMGKVKKIEEFGHL